MAIETDYLDMMPDTVTFYGQSALDKYGKRTWASTGASFRARVQDQSRLYRDAQGREVVLTGKAYLYGATAAGITTDSKIVLPDGSSPVIYLVTTNSDESGAHHVVVEYGSSSKRSG